ncbi:MAG: chemotaxis protein CheD [Candidatus Cloacimonetes bacterium]|nr:chemotaxis protein CheD [Candidatus Cloacimonadota bacterium]
MGFDAPTVKYLIKPGYLITYSKPMMIYGVLGSGLFLALWDQKRKYSGCCLYLYPMAEDESNLTAKYGNVAVNHLINRMCTEGSKTEDLKAHLIGGGSKDNSQIGEKNILIAEKILKKRGIEIYSNDVGGKLGRKFAYETNTGQNMIMKVHNIRESNWYPYISKGK